LCGLVHCRCTITSSVRIGARRWQVRKLKFTNTDLTLVVRMDATMKVSRTTIGSHCAFGSMEGSPAPPVRSFFADAYRHDDLSAFYQRCVRAEATDRQLTCRPNCSIDNSAGSLLLEGQTAASWPRGSPSIPRRAQRSGQSRASVRAWQRCLKSFRGALGPRRSARLRPGFRTGAGRSDSGGWVEA
jgi:hypothetical protein